MSKTGSEPNWNLMSDEELAQHCTSEMGECLDELIGRCKKRVRDCANRMSLNRHQAEDLVGDIYLRLMTSLPNFEGRSAFGTWLFRLAHNTCVDAYRRDMRQARITTAHPVRWQYNFNQNDLLAEFSADWGDPSINFDAQIRECYLAQALARLPWNYYQIVFLRLSEGRSNEDVAHILGTSTESVKAKLQRARHRLREDLLVRKSCPFCQSIGTIRINAKGEVS